MKNRRNQEEEEEGFFLVGIGREGEGDKKTKAKGKANPFPLVILFMAYYHIISRKGRNFWNTPFPLGPILLPFFFYCSVFFIQCETTKSPRIKQ